MEDYFKECLGLQGASFSQIEHEDAIVAVVYKVILESGEASILKICDREKDFLREVYFLKLLSGKIPVPRIMDIVPPEEGIHGAILMECLPGALLQASDMTKDLAHELGHNFALIHEHRLEGYGDPIQELTDDPREYFRFKFQEGLDECKSHLSREICQKYFDSHVDLLKEVDGPCIVHRDFRPGNLMVHQGRLQGIIDWAGARASFAEEDFCSIEHVGWLSREKESFLSGYSSIRPVPKYSRLLSFLRLYKAVATIGFTVKRGTFKTRDKRLYEVNRKFLEALL